MYNDDGLKEKIVHGEITFPFCAYCNQTADDEQILFCHWHEEVEFIYLKRGNATFYLDASPIEISAGEAIFIDSEVIHSGFSKEFDDCCFDAIVFDLHMLCSSTLGSCQNEYLLPLIKKHCSLPFKYSTETNWQKEVIQQLNAIRKLFADKKAGYEFAIAGSLYTILSIIISNDQLIQKNHKYSEHNKHKLDQFKMALHFIQKNYHNKISIADIARDANMSQYHFCRFFKTMSGKTPFQYLTDFRIHQAEILLNNTEKKISEIALDVGFNTLSYFIKCFKNIKKNTPSEFRDL